MAGLVAPRETTKRSEHRDAMLETPDRETLRHGGTRHTNLIDNNYNFQREEHDDTTSNFDDNNIRTVAVRNWRVRPREFWNTSLNHKLLTRLSYVKRLFLGAIARVNEKKVDETARYQYD